MTSRRRVFSGWLVLLVAVAAGGSSDDATAGPAPTFQNVREEVRAFRADASRKKFRHNYERYITKMRGVAARAPEDGQADDALYVAAQLLEELHQASGVGKDLEDAIAAYEEMARRYPKSNLADDALFAAAKMRLERQGDRAGARRLLERVAKMPGNADFKPQAKELLARLPAPPPEPTPVASAPVEGDRVSAILERVKNDVEPQSPAPAVPELKQIEVLPDPPPKGTPARRVVSVRAEKKGSERRVRVRLSNGVGIVRGEAPAEAGKPRRIFFDLIPAKLGKRSIKPLELKNHVIRRVRAGQYDENTVRVVIELVGQEEPLLTLNKRPFELVFSVPNKPPVAPSPVAVAPVAPVADPVPSAGEVRKRLGSDGSPGGVSISQQMGLKVRRIIIDAGHGGKDTGAIGPKGTREKDVTLAIAKKVRDKLKADLPDIEVIMTRSDDTFVELADRTAIANEAGADLFISIHANANPSRKVRGVETYYLNITNDRYNIRLAARENAAAGENSISDLDFILADLAMKSNVDDSIRLGRHVQGSVVSRLRKDYSEVNDLGLKHALFFVLLGSKMPAILVETSFISNRMEEKRLKTSAYQAAVADGVVSGVKSFLDERHAFNTR